MCRHNNTGRCPYCIECSENETLDQHVIADDSPKPVAFRCCDMWISADGYRRHMDDVHNGHSNCVLMVNEAKLLRILRGEDYVQVACMRGQ